MSESASDQKVEDVLSSVRRLVSGELPRKPRADLPEGPGALVLTNAQRVADAPKPRAVSKSLEDRIAELEAAVGDQNDEFEPDGSEDQAQHRPDRIVYTRPPSNEEQAQARRDTLRLSQISLIETGPANDDNTEDDAVVFHHVQESASEVDEAPMAVDVPTERPTSVDVAAFSNPDDVVERLEARLEGGPEVVAEKVNPAPEMVSLDAQEDALDTDLEMDDEAFEDALSQAIEDQPMEPGVDAQVDYEADSVDEAVDEMAAAEPAADELGVAEVFEIADDFEEIDAPSEADESAEFAPDEGDAEPVAEDEVFDAVDAMDDPVPTSDVEDVSEDIAPEIVEFDNVGTAPADVPSEAVEENPAPVTEPTVEPPVTPDKAAAVASAALDMLADEEAARLLVARLIREELQGNLGEQITRNVRKLVRREIMRALDARDLS